MPNFALRRLSLGRRTRLGRMIPGAASPLPWSSRLEFRRTPVLALAHSAAMQSIDGYVVRVEADRAAGTGGILAHRSTG